MMLETAVGFITEVGVVGLGIYFWRLLMTERVVMGSRFREIQKDRDYWRNRSHDLETKLSGVSAEPPRTK